MPTISPTTAYLLAYNSGIGLAYVGLLTKIVTHLATSKGDITTLYHSVRPLLRFCVEVPFLEILHAAAGLVRSPVATTAIQTLTRIIVVEVGLAAGSVEAQQSGFALSMISAWTSSEIIRYSYYAANLLSQIRAGGSGVDKTPSPSPSPPPYALTWLRYSAFLGLYPVGFIGEMGTLYRALPFLRSSGTYSIRLPNRYNFSFDCASVITFALIALYPPGSYSMYTYMLSQRKKTLQKEAEKHAASSSPA